MFSSSICRTCASHNHFHFDPSRFAIECWNCGERQWLSEDTKQDYMLTYNKSETDANADLISGNMPCETGHWDAGYQ